MIVMKSKIGVVISAGKNDEGETVINLRKISSIGAEHLLSWITLYLQTEEVAYDACTALQEAIKAYAKYLSKAGRKDIEIIEIHKDYSFEDFWEAYAYKVGKKDRVRRRWEAMGRVERTMAMQHIRRYNYFLSTNPGIQRKYPETYLKAEEWNN